jgi:hypothetical protein
LKASPALIAANQRINREKRQRSLDAYYENPNYCETCKKIIEIKPAELVSTVRKKKFCSRSCAARFNNRGVDRWKTERGNKTSSRVTTEKQGPCEVCGRIIEYTKHKEGLLYNKRKYCENCYSEVRTKLTRLRHKKNGTALPKKIENLTKGELRKHYQGNPFKLKTRITSHANRTFIKFNKEKKCAVCGYEITVQVSHKKAVADFGEDVLISEINHIDNLIGLCPNHHYEYDKGLLKL